MASKTEIVNNDIVNELQTSLSTCLSQYGFECCPFKTGWYNEKVDSKFHLDYDDDTLAFCVVSVPQMFEKAFKPFIQSIKEVGVKDPIDECVEFYYGKIKQEFPSHDIDTIQDNDLHPNRRPKLLVQTAGHVSGMAYYYQRSDIQKDPWPEKKRIYGVSLHPKFGGWFAFRGALIFKNLRCPDLPVPETSKLLTTDDSIIDLLEKLNNNWKDNSFRDVITPVDRYSEEQQIYFDTLPKDRAKLLGLEKLEKVKLSEGDGCCDDDSESQ